MTALAACPFCGEAPIAFAVGPNDAGMMIECVASRCVHPHVSFIPPSAAIAAWNRRAPSVTPSPADLKALVGAARRTRMFMEDMGISKSVVDGFLASALAPFEGS